MYRLLSFFALCALLNSSLSVAAQDSNAPLQLTPEQRAEMKKKLPIKQPQQRVVFPNMEYKRTNQKGVEIPPDKNKAWLSVNGASAPTSNTTSIPKNPSAGLRKAAPLPQPKPAPQTTLADYKTKVVTAINQRLAELQKIKQPTESDKAEIAKLKKYLLDAQNTK